MDCKVVLGTEMPTQHRLLVLVFRMRRKIFGKKIKVRQTIMWGRLKGDMVATVSNKIMTPGYPSISDDANQMWATMAKTNRKVAKETLGVSTGKLKVYKESWWWNEDVQKNIKDKNRRFKELMACTEEEEEEEDKTHKKERYKEAKQAAKKAVAEAKNRAFDAFYQKLDTKEGKIFKLEKARTRQKKDLGIVKFIKDEGRRVLLRQEDIKMR